MPMQLARLVGNQVALSIFGAQAWDPVVDHGRFFRLPNQIPTAVPTAMNAHDTAVHTTPTHDTASSMG